MYIFENVDDALLRLSSHAKNFYFPINADLVTPNDIIKFSVQQNVFRGLRSGNYHPSDIYRSWATEKFEEFYNTLRSCKNSQEFDTMIKLYTDSFLGDWNIVSGRKIVYGPASKIVNLLIKTIQESKEFRIESIVRFQHIPWDSYTLRPLKKIINELANTNYYINIPTTAAMSFVNSEELYKALRIAVFNLYDMLPGNPPVISFDYFAWNNNH